MNKETKLKDEITQKIGVLTRRETEARILVPFFQALSEKFGKEEVAPILEKTIMDLSRSQGAELSKKYGSGVDSFLETLHFWTQDGALEVILEKIKKRLVSMSRGVNMLKCITL